MEFVGFEFIYRRRRCRRGKVRHKQVNITIDNAEGSQLILVGGNPPGSSLENLCRSWVDSLDNFIYTAPPVESLAEDLVDILDAAIAGNPRTDIYIAGPGDWIEEILAKARSKSIDPADWHTQAID